MFRSMTCGNLQAYLPRSSATVAISRSLSPSGCWHTSWSVASAQPHCAGFSLLIEISQYIFQLGFSDIDDLLFNTLGTAAGAFIASLFGSRAQWVWVTLTAVLTVVFIVLVILGPSLGDPDRVAEVNASGIPYENGFSGRSGAHQRQRLFVPACRYRALPKTTQEALCIDDSSWLWI